MKTLAREHDKATIVKWFALYVPLRWCGACPRGVRSVGFSDTSDDTASPRGAREGVRTGGAGAGKG